MKFVAKFVGRSVGTVGRWVGKWRRNVLDSIRTEHAGNRNSCLLAEEQEEVLKALCPRVRKGREDVIVVSADDVGIEHEAILRRAWYVKNTKVKLRVDRERKSQKRIGVLHETGGSVDLMRLDRGNIENIVKALIKLTLKYLGKKIVVVWDNASRPQLQGVEHEVGGGREPQKGSVDLYLPLYSPDQANEIQV